MIPGPLALSGSVSDTRPDLFRSFVIGSTGGQSFVRVNNVNYLVSSNTGEGSKVFQVFNADTGQLHATFDTPAKANAGHAHDGNGNFYVESSDLIFSFNIVNKTLHTVSAMPSAVESGMDAKIDYQGRLWFGTYSSQSAGAARVVCVSPTSGAEISRSPRLGTNNAYIQEMSISEDGKTLWCGVGTVTPCLYSVDVDNPSLATQYTIPNCAPNQNTRAQVRGDSVFVWHNNTQGATIVSALHIPTGTWRVFPHNPAGRSLTNMDPNGKVYFARLGTVYSFSPSDTTYTATAVAQIPDHYPRNLHIINNVIYALQAGDEQLSTNRIDLTTGTVTRYSNAIVQIPLSVQSLVIEPTTDTAYAGGYQGDGLCTTDLATGAFAHSGSVGVGQIEGMMLDNRRLYIGSYGDAKIFHHNTLSAVNVPSSYRRLITMYPTYPQDRPFAWANTPNHVVFGTVPKPGYRGGALGVVNKATNAVDIYTSLVPNHSIIDMTPDPNTPTTVYVTTSGRAGYGLDDYLGQAVIFAFDVNTRTVLWTKQVPNSLELYGPVILNNKMYVANAMYVWELDMQANVLQVFEVYEWAGRAGWKNVELMALPNSNRLVHISGGYIRVLDPTTSQVSQLLPDRVLPHMDFDSNNNIWVAQDNGIVKVALQEIQPLGAIGHRYTLLGGVSAFGYPATAEESTNVDSGVVQKYHRNGKDYYFYYNSQHGAHLVAANTGIGGRFFADGGHSYYGLPTTDEVAVSGGAYQSFQKGSELWRILWSSATGGNAVKLSGAIGQSWQSAGAQSGWGFPETGEYTYGSQVRQRFVKNGVTTTACWASGQGVWTI